jgi:hypothetical protein
MFRQLAYRHPFISAIELCRIPVDSGSPQDCMLSVVLNGIHDGSAEQVAGILPESHCGHRLGRHQTTPEGPQHLSYTLGMNSPYDNGIS